MAGIRITCKLLAAAMMECFQKEEELKILDVANSDLVGLKAALTEASFSTDKSAVAFGYNYSALELLNALQSFLCRSSNCAVLMDSSLVVPITNFLHRGERAEKIAAVKFIWYLLEHKEVKEYLLKEHKSLMDLLKIELDRGGADEDLSLWCKGILVAMQVPHSSTGKSFQYVNQEAKNVVCSVQVCLYTCMCAVFTSHYSGKQAIHVIVFHL